MVLPVLMILLGGLMMSHILYPVVPKFGVRTAKGLFTLLLMLVSIVAAFTIPALFFFPMAMLYITYGVVKALVMGFIDRMPERDPLLDEEPGDEAGAELREIEYGETMAPEQLQGRWRAERRFRHRRRPGSSDDS